jgi:pleiotropic regulator 1
LFTGSEEGGMRFYDWETSTMFQHGMTASAPGTVLGEGGILASTFDPSGKRLLTAEGDKTVKMWWETPSDAPSAAAN